MTARENAIEIIHFGRPERVVAGPPVHVIAYHGCNHEGFDGGGHDSPVGTRWTDIWGTVWYKRQEGVMAFPEAHPLAHPDRLRSYRWPDPNDPRVCGAIYTQAQHRPADGSFLTGSHRDTLWEKAYMLVGMENMMAAFYEAPDFAREVLHHIMDFQLGIAEHYLSVGVEMVNMTDDLGTQTGPLLSPAIVERFLRPEYARLMSLYKQHGVLVNFHSCGSIEAFLPMFMDLGVDILNPVQATANDLDMVRSLTQGRIALQGAVATQTLMDGPPDRIRAEVRFRLWQLGRRGGYFCAPDQYLPFPQTHIDAFYSALDEYGRYPLSPPD